MLENIEWLGHASVKISGEKIIYIDPWNIKKEDKADIILITHSHYDHCSPEDIERLRKEGTVVVAPQDCISKTGRETKVLQPGEKLTLGVVEIEAVPAYNLKKPFHPRTNQWVGYIVSMGGKRIYHAGDTDLIPEMEGIRADIALLPMGGTYTMDAQEAAQAANRIKPQIAAIPIHFGTIVGSERDAQRFKELCTVEVKILSSSS